MYILTSSILKDILFIAGDFAAVSMFNSHSLAKNLDLFLIAEFSACILYGLSIRLIGTWKTFALQNKKFEEMHPGLFFWLRLSHIFGFIYLPIGLLVTYLASGARGNETFAVVMFILMPALSIFVIREVGTEERTPADRFPWYAKVLVNEGFIISFAFFDSVFSYVGYFICLQITKEVISMSVSKPAWYFLLIYRIFFIWIFYIPMRMWLLLPEEKSLIMKISFAISIIVILVNGFMDLGLIAKLF